MCRNGDGKQNCREKNVVYEIACLKCAETNKNSKYVGQTSRSAYERGSEHLKGLLDKNENNPLYKHAI